MTKATPTHIPRLPRDIWALGGVSLFMDMSSELIHSLLPLFLVTTLGASVLALGLLEGVAEAAAALVKLFSGRLSDLLRRRKPLVMFGYALAALSKPLFPLATSVSWVVAARLMDRLGKGIRGAPRDALIADIAAPAQRGAAFGLRQSLDSLGAVLGPALAIGLMLALANDVRRVMWLAVVPAVIAVLLVMAVREPEAAPRHPAAATPLLSLADARALPSAFWWVVGLAALFNLARFSEAFLILRATDLGLMAALAPAVMIVMSATYTLAAYPAGVLSDRIGSRGLLVSGLLALVIADLTLAYGHGPLAAMFGAAIWGVHMGLTQGLLSRLVADHSPAALRGTAFGVMSLVTAVALLIASAVAGALWTLLGATATFVAGAGLAMLAILAVPRATSRSPA